MDNKKKLEIEPLVIEHNYLSFDEFLKNEKYQIYHKILNAFEQMFIDKNGDRKLYVVAKIDGRTFDTKFNINKKNTELLKAMRSFFEEVEEYECCSKILKLCSEFEKELIG